MTEKIQTGHVMHSSHIRKDKSQIVINIITYILVTIFCIMCIMPFWMIVASSFATEDSVRRSGFTLWPTDLTITLLILTSARFSSTTSQVIMCMRSE